jgi:endonuclease YncB( thermonuclease family)
MRKANMPRALVALIISLLFLACTKTLNPNGDFTCPKPKSDVSVLESQTVVVTKVADGDTFTACLLPDMSASVRVRVLGIDCPEAKVNQKCKREGQQGRPGCEAQIPLGKKASALAHRLLLRKTVTLESRRGDGEFERDIYGRLLAYVRTQNVDDYGKYMIKEGGCENYQWKYPHPRGAEYGRQE